MSQELRLIRRITLKLIPFLILLYLIAYVDRSAVGFAKLHMGADIGIGDAAYGLGAGLFFIGYAIFEVPSNLLLQRYGARAWLTRIMFTWGTAAMAMAFVQGETSFYVLRFILGAAEAFMDGEMELVQGDIMDLIGLIRMNTPWDRGAKSVL
mgnify:CR=1 FL=1